MVLQRYVLSNLKYGGVPRCFGRRTNILHIGRQERFCNVGIVEKRLTKIQDHDMVCSSLFILSLDWKTALSTFQLEIDFIFPTIQQRAPSVYMALVLILQGTNQHNANTKDLFCDSARHCSLNQTKNRSSFTGATTTWSCHPPWIATGIPKDSRHNGHIEAP